VKSGARSTTLMNCDSRSKIFIASGFLHKRSLFDSKRAAEA
jgi:hypothetical protein